MTGCWHRRYHRDTTSAGKAVHLECCKCGDTVSCYAGKLRDPKTGICWIGEEH